MSKRHARNDPELVNKILAVLWASEAPLNCVEISHAIHAGHDRATRDAGTPWPDESAIKRAITRMLDQGLVRAESALRTHRYHGATRTIKVRSIVYTAAPKESTPNDPR